VGGNVRLDQELPGAGEFEIKREFAGADPEESSVGDYWAGGRGGVRWGRQSGGVAASARHRCDVPFALKRVFKAARGRSQLRYSNACCHRASRRIGGEEW